jgi:hypothetical protein
MTEIFKRFSDENITPNAYYVLNCIKEKIVPNNFINSSLECKKLQVDNWLTEDLRLTSKSLIFIEEINGYFKKSKKKSSKVLMGDDFLRKIEEYVNVFPNKRLPSGKYAKTTPKNLEVAFRWFFETYDYEWDTILKATEKYVEEYEVRNFEYMRTAQYFLRKQNNDKSFESDLANYCEIIKSSPEDHQVHFKERIV